jgi:hypothetical protein
VRALGYQLVPVGGAIAFAEAKRADDVLRPFAITTRLFCLLDEHLRFVG